MRQLTSILTFIVSAIFSNCVYGQTNPFEEHQKYDERGNLIENVGLTPVGEIAEIYYSEYDSLNRLIKSYKTDAKATTKEWINTYEYNDKNQLIRRNWYPSEKMLLYQYETYKYDSVGNKIELVNTVRKMDLCIEKLGNMIRIVFSEFTKRNFYNMKVTE